MKTYVMAMSLVIMTTLSAIPSFADTYNLATFDGAIYGGNANAQAPFSPSIHQGGAISGGFVIDNSLIPGAGTGFVNVSFSDFPDIAKIPAATAFNINLGTALLTFNLANDLTGQAAIQFNNGKFNGFSYSSIFTYTDGNEYDFWISGRTWFINYFDPSLGYHTTQLVSGYINGMTLGDGFTPVDPNNPVPEPGTMMLLGIGMAGLAIYGKRRQNKQA